VTLFVDTSVWSLAFRRDAVSSVIEIVALRQALEGGEMVVTTGLVLQELLQGFVGPRARRDIILRFAALPFLDPDRQDHIEAAELRNRCRRSGIQIGTIDALLAQLCIRHDLILLTTDRDFVRIASNNSVSRQTLSGSVARRRTVSSIGTFAVARR
jgi:predicted nucleic acid-binding protein